MDDFLPGCGCACILIVALICIFTGPTGWWIGLILVGVAVVSAAIVVAIQTAHEKNKEELRKKEEGQKRIKEAAEKQRAEREANRWRQRRETLQRSLMKAEHMKEGPIFNAARVKCANGHIYKLEGFKYVSGTVMNSYTTHRTTYERVNTQTSGNAYSTNDWGFPTSGDGTHYEFSQQTTVPKNEQETHTNSELVWEFGCPLCKTTEYVFENPEYNDYEFCERCENWYRKRFAQCPLCDPETVVVACSQCGQKNRVPAMMVQVAACAKCGARCS